jgi:hypothetical protein
VTKIGIHNSAVHSMHGISANVTQQARGQGDLLHALIEVAAEGQALQARG